MKYLTISLLFHIGALILLTYSPFNSANTSSPVVIVELYIPPSNGAIENQTNSKPLTKSRKHETKTHSPQTLQKSIQTHIEKPTRNLNKNNSLQATENFLKSSEGKQMLASYAEQLKLYLEQNKVYPRIALRMKHSGTVKIKLEIKTDGEFGEIKVVSPSPFNTLNTAAVDLLKGLGRFKPLPSEFKMKEEFIIPIAYQIKGAYR